MPQIRNKLLRGLYAEAEFDREHDEVNEIEAAVRHLVNEIAETISEKEPLFNNTVLQSGSFYEDLKVEGPNEFDFMICLENLSQPDVCEVKEIPFRSVRDPGYVHVQVKDSDLRRRWQRYISKKENLKPKPMLEKFQALVKDALVEKRDHFHKKLLTNFEVELRKIPVTLKLVWNGTKYQNYEISVDLVLCIRMAGWPNDSDVNKRYNRSHPSYEMIRNATQDGYHLIASCIGESGKPRPCWRLSFSRAEGILLQHLSEMSPLLVHKTGQNLKSSAKEK